MFCSKRRIPFGSEFEVQPQGRRPHSSFANRHSVPLRAGFSLIELLISSVLMVFLIAAIYTLFVSYKKAVLVEEEKVEIQQGSRVALGRIKEDIELIGAGIRRDGGQEAVIYAAPWEMVFNADLGKWGTASSGELDFGEMATTQQITYGPSDTIYKGFCVPDPDTCGGNCCGTAETIHYYMGNSTSRDYSYHDYDQEILRRINDQTDPDGNPIVTVVGFGIRYDDGTQPYNDGTHIRPLFTFWGDFDFDPTTPDTLWGDSSGDGELSSGEIAALVRGNYSWGSLGNMPDGAIFLNKKGADLVNSEVDANSNDVLDPDEDINHNGRFDVNLLDGIISRIDLKVSMIAQRPDPSGVAFHPGTEFFREHTVSTSVDPKNLGKPEEGDCGPPPGAPTSCSAAEENCGYGIRVSWFASQDDGNGADDVLWYEILRAAGPGSPNFVFYSIQPALGQASYSFLDTDIVKEPEYDENPLSPTYGEFIGWTFFPHRYKIHAVDCGNSESPGCITTALTPTTSYPQDPAEVDVWDTPCYVDTTSSSPGRNYGSITVMLEKSPDSDISEYWIFRSDANAVEYFNENHPIAKIPTNPSATNGPNTTCATGASSLIDAERRCAGVSYYRYADKYYVWRDDSFWPGRTISLPPFDGSAFGLRDGGYGTGGSTTGSGFDPDRMNLYSYKVKSYRSSDECLSRGLRYSSKCGNYFEAQSFNSYDAAGLDPGRYSPPWNVRVYDVSEYDDLYGTIHPKLKVLWNASPSQFCESTSSPDNDIPTMTRYYIYRSKRPLTYDPFDGRLQRVLLIEDAFKQPTGEFNVYRATPQVVVFKGVGIGSYNTLGYSFTDEESVHTGGDVWYIQTGSSGDLRPQNATADPNISKLDDDPDEIPDNVYEYMVAAVNANPSSPDIEYCSLVNSNRLTDDLEDAIEVSWQWDAAGGPPPAGSTVYLVAKDANAFNPEWEKVDLVIQPPAQIPSDCGTGTSYCTGYHRYDAPAPYSSICPGIGYTYGLQVECTDPTDPSLPTCARTVNLGVIEYAGLPEQAHICYQNRRPAGSPACPDATRDCSTGKVAIELRDVMPSCSGTILTDRQYMWWRVVRYSLPADDWNGNPDTFGQEPDNGDYECIKTDPSCVGTCGSTCAGTYHYTGYWLNLGRDTTASGNPVISEAELTSASGHTYSGYGGNLVNVRKITGDPATPAWMNRYMFSEVVNPTMVYRYDISVMISHPPEITKPVCTDAYPSCPPSRDQCNGAVWDLTEFTVIADFSNEIQCYPPAAAPLAGGGLPVYPVGAWDNFNWRGSGDIGKTSQPWRNDPASFLGISWFQDIMFVYSGSHYIRSDMDNFFSALLGWLYQWLFDIAFDMCDWCFTVLGVPLFCVDWVWPTCSADLVSLRNHSFLWSNFNAGVCGSNGPGESHYFDGDFMLQFHGKINQSGRQINPAFRGQYKPYTFAHNAYIVSINHQGANRVEYVLSFVDGSNEGSSYQELAHTHENFGNDSRDTMWWSVFIIVCSNHVAESGHYDESFVYMWAKVDNSKTWDWKANYYTEDPVLRWDLGHGTRNTVGGSSGVGQVTRTGAIRPNCASWCWQHGCPGGGTCTACNTGAPLRCVDYKDGKVGFWADPFIDFSATEYRYDNIRIDSYCGRCPPSHLVGTSLKSGVVEDHNLKGGSFDDF